MKFREQRGLLVDSMETVVEIDNTREAVASHARKLLEDFGVYPAEYIAEMTADRVVCEHYCKDDRIGWDTYLLTSNFEPLYVIGYCNMPLRETDAV